MEHKTKSDEDTVNAIAYNQDEPEIDIEFEDGPEHRINGIAEFAFGFWSRWSRVFPIDVPVKADWYEMARFTTNRNHGDIKTYGDRALAIYLGKGVYHFVTYQLGVENGGNNYKNLDYGSSLEGHWNYIHYGYKRTGNEGIARAFVHFS